MEKIEIQIGCPRDTVFGVVADLRTWKRWHGSEDALIEKVSEGRMGVGTVWASTTTTQGEELTVSLEITDYEAPLRFALKSTSGDARQSFAFEEVDGGTRLTTVLELADPAQAESARQQWEADLQVLKQLLELQVGV